MPEKKREKRNGHKNQTLPKSKQIYQENPIVESVAKETGQDNMSARQRTKYAELVKRPVILQKYADHRRKINQIMEETATSADEDEWPANRIQLIVERIQATTE